jgi:hypothetical protein
MTIEAEEKQRQTRKLQIPVIETQLQKHESQKFMLAKKSNMSATMPMDYNPPAAKVVEVADQKAENHSHTTQPKNLKIVCGGFTIGKNDTCEDAFFTSERSFGVADGVSGWCDFGFSSQEFANQLMNFSKLEVETFDCLPSVQSENKQEFKRLRKRGSYIDFDEGVTEEKTQASQMDLTSETN